VDLAASRFDFDNLTSFIDATYLLKGEVTTHVSARGSLNNLNLEKLIVELQDSRLEAAGKLRNITGGDKMIINTVFTDSYINQNDANNLLQTFKLPVYEELGRLTFDSLSYAGSPLNFNSGIKLKTDKGNITANAHLNLEKDEFEYDISIGTRDFNIFPFTGITSNLNSNGSLKGIGLSPENIIAEIKLKGDESIIDGNYFQNLNVEANGSNGIIKAGLSFISGDADGSLNVDLDITDESKPSYKFSAALNEFDIYSFSGESDIQSSLNFSFEGEGENFNQDDVNLFASLIIENSTIRGLTIDSTRAIVDIRNEADQRVINVISDLADITLSGNFKIADLVSVISSESKIFSDAITNKLRQIQPPGSFDNINIYNLQDEKQDEEILTDNLSFEIDLYYALEFKDFELLSLVLGGSEIEIDGELSGKLTTFTDSIAANLNTNLHYFKFWDGKELIYLSQLELESSFVNKLSSTNLTNLETDINLKAKKIFFGSEFENLSLDLDYKNNIAVIDLNVVIEKLIRTKFDGIININGDMVSVVLDDLLFRYNDYNLVNRKKIDVSYSKNQFNFNQFNLAHNNGEIILSGMLSTEGKQDFNLKLKNIGAKDLSTDFFALPPDISMHGLINLAAQLNGVADFPELTLNLNIDSLDYKNQPLGSLSSSIEFANQQLIAEVKLVNESLRKYKPNLIFSGNIPIDVSLNRGATLLLDKDVFLSFKSEGLELAPFGSAVSEIHQLQGKFDAEVSATGKLDNLNTVGLINIDDASFILQSNKLKYYMGLDLKFDDDMIELSNLFVRNSDETKDGGTITGHGYFTHRNFSPLEVDISLNGKLKLLSRSSSSANTSLYGDLVVETREDIVYKFNRNQNHLTADLLLKKGANVTFSPTNSAFTNDLDKFIYHFKTETDSLDDKEIDSLIVISESVSQELKASSKAPFDINVKLEVEDEAKMIFVLSKEFNYDLTAYLGGNFEYVLKNEVPIAEGELVLLEGSKLNFIKTFQAEGSVKFFSEIDNPYLDIIATYQNYYNPDTLGAASEYEVQVRIQLEGPVQNLSTNFIQNENNISIYKRATGGGQFELDATKTTSDAMFFIILGKFPEDANTQETNLVASTAASLAGSLIGGFLNEKLGDIVRSVQV
ncbi:MAG: translocation/assembly module TamB, partial [Ignavibacteria bacterium]|nr:translocation/assembly module TamB [Ignavibacteria bacterium]